MKALACQNKRRLLLFALLAVGFAARLLFIGQYPTGFNQDEASAGYEAWALLTSGIDRNGNAWPALLVSWGSGQNVLLTYLAMPFVALLGLTELAVRLPQAICGCLTLPVFYLLVRRLRDEKCALAALFFLAVNPWHICMSRWALESNLLPFFLLLGLYFLVLAYDNPRWFPAAFAAFALCCYCYGTVFYFLPLFGLYCLYFFLRRKRLPWKWFLPSVAVFLLLAAPVILTNLINILDWPQMELFGMTLPRLTETRQASASVFGPRSDSLRHLVQKNVIDLVKLLVTGDDGQIWSAAPHFGLYYYIGLPLAALGVIDLVFHRKARADGEWLVLHMAAFACMAVCLIYVNTNRANMVFLPLLYFSGVGLSMLLSWAKRAAFVPVAAILAAFALFLGVYFGPYQSQTALDLSAGIGDAILFAGDQTDGEICYSDQLCMPYMFTLFYEQIPPEDYLSTVEYSDPENGFRHTVRFCGRYAVRSFEKDGVPAAVCVLKPEELPLFSDGYALHPFGAFYVAVPESAG